MNSVPRDPDRNETQDSDGSGNSGAELRISVDDPELAEKLVAVAQTTTVAYSGPLPPASEFERYCIAEPTAGQSILKIAETQQKHRNSHEMQHLKGALDDNKHARLVGLGAFVVTCASAVACAFAGMEVVATAFLGAGVLGIVGTIIRNRITLD